MEAMNTGNQDGKPWAPRHPPHPVRPRCAHQQNRPSERAPLGRTRAALPNACLLFWVLESFLASSLKNQVRCMLS